MMSLLDPMECPRTGLQGKSRRRGEEESNRELVKRLDSDRALMSKPNNLTRDYYRRGCA
jgi:hypothetical protein